MTLLSGIFRASTFGFPPRFFLFCGRFPRGPFPNFWLPLFFGRDLSLVAMRDLFCSRDAFFFQCWSSPGITGLVLFRWSFFFFFFFYSRSMSTNHLSFDSPPGSRLFWAITSTPTPLPAFGFPLQTFSFSKPSSGSVGSFLFRKKSYFVLGLGPGGPLSF